LLGLAKIELLVWL